MKGLSFVWVFLLVFIERALSQTGDDAKNLRKQLLVTNKYDKNVIPMEDQSETRTVYVSLYLLNINGLNEVDETLTTTGYLVISWHDDFLVWNTDDYGGLGFAIWPQDEIWKPDITLRNSVLEYKELGSSGLKVELDNEGFVSWYPFQVFKSTCNIDITYFPFDVQTCKLVFVAWSYTKADVILRNGSLGVNLNEYESSPLWDITSTSVSVDEDNSDSSITFTIRMKRKPMYFILSIIFPIVLLAILNVCAFTLPCESGERAGYTITVFLALAVFLTIIAASLPANSESTSIFSVYVLIQTVQSTIITLLALITIRLSSKETSVPRCLAALTRCMNCMGCRDKNVRRSSKRSKPGSHRYKNGDAYRYNNGEINRGVDIPAYELGYRTSNKMDGSFRDGEDVYSRRDKDAETSGDDITWLLAVRTIDLVFFVFFFTVFLVSTIVCIAISVQ